MIAETDRLVLREFRGSDLDDFASIMADPLVMEFSVSGPWDFDRTKVVLEKQIQKWGLQLLVYSISKEGCSNGI